MKTITSILDLLSNYTLPTEKDVTTTADYLML